MDESMTRHFPKREAQFKAQMSNAYNNPQRPQVDYATEEHHISRDHPKSRSNIIVAASMATLNQSRQHLIIKIQRRVHSI